MEGVRMMRRAVIFDMDGVITDTEKYYVEAMIMHLKECGHDVAPEDLSDLYGSTMMYIWGKLIRRYGLEQDLKKHVDRVHELRDHLIRTKGLWPMPGVVELIRGLDDAGVLLAVASSAPIETIRHNMEILKISECFDVMVSGLECEHGKPAPDIFLLAAEKLGVLPEESVVIEDSGNGVKAAKAAGMYCHAYVPPQAYRQDVSAADDEWESFVGLTVEDV